MTFSKETCDGIPTYFIKYNSKEKEGFLTYGIEKFNNVCRELVWSNEKSFSDLTAKMGQFIDLEHPYVTYDNNYIETEWWILKNKLQLVEQI